MKSGATRILDARSIGAIVATVGLEKLYDLAIERVADVITSHASAQVEMKQRDGFLLTSPDLGLLEWMPAVRYGATVCVKLVGYNPHNPGKNQLPTIVSTICAFDSGSGHLRTIMDGTFSTAIRTGAASAVASRILASPSSAVLGLVGCGVQAVTQLHALSRAFTFTEILVYDPDVAAESSFADRARVPRGMVRAAPLGEIERAADILCTATSVFPGDGPVIAGREMKPTVHINAVGSDMQGKTELPLALLRNAIVCPDDVMQARREGECQQLGSGGIGPSLTSLLLDPHENLDLHSRCTVYDSTGLALQDLAMAEMFDDFAQQTGIGEAVGLEACLDDPRDPYSFLPSASLTMPEIGGGSW